MSNIILYHYIDSDLDSVKAAWEEYDGISILQVGETTRLKVINDYVKDLDEDSICVIFFSGLNEEKLEEVLKKVETTKPERVVARLVSPSGDDSVLEEVFQESLENTDEEFSWFSLEEKDCSIIACKPPEDATKHVDFLVEALSEDKPLYEDEEEQSNEETVEAEAVAEENSIEEEETVEEETVEEEPQAIEEVVEEETLADKLASKVAQAVENASEEVAVDPETNMLPDESESLEETKTYVRVEKPETSDIPKEVMDLAIALHNILKAK